MIVGWCVSFSMNTGLVLDAMEQSIRARNDCEARIHNSEWGCQYLSIHLAKRFAEAI
jgi:transposase InsO family protein